MVCRTVRKYSLLGQCQRSTQVPGPEVTLPLWVLGVVTGGCCPLSRVIGSATVGRGQNHTCSVRMLGCLHDGDSGVRLSP